MAGSSRVVAGKKVIERAPKEIGKKRDGFAKKGLEAKGVHGLRKPGLERSTRRVKPTTVRRAVENITTYHKKLEKLSLPDLKTELSRLRVKIKELTLKMNKAKKLKKAVFEKELGPLLHTERFIVDLISSGVAERRYEERKLSQEALSPDKQFEELFSGYRMEFNYAVSVGNKQIMKDVLQKIDILMKTRVREMSTEFVVKLSELRDKIESSQNRITLPERAVKKEPAQIERRAGLPVKYTGPGALEKRISEAPIEKLLASFFEGIKDPEKNGEALEKLSLGISNSAQRTYLELLGREDLTPDQRRQALLLFREQINNFLSETRRRLQLMNRTKILDVRYVKNLFNTLTPYLEQVDRQVQRLTPKKSTEGRRVELAEVYRARDVFRTWPEDAKHRAMILRDRLTFAVAETQGEKSVAPVIDEVNKALVKLGPKEGIEYLLDRVKHVESLRVKLLPAPQERKALPSPSPEAVAERAAKAADAELEKQKKKIPPAFEVNDLVRRIERVRNEVRGNREVLARMVDLQKALMELTISKAGKLEHGLETVREALNDLTARVRMLDEGLSRTIIDGIGTISDQMNKFLERFSEDLERERKLTNEHLQDIKKIAQDLKDVINTGLRNLDKLPAIMETMSGEVKQLRSESKERHDEVVAQLRQIKEDVETAKTELKENMSTIFDSRLFEINKSIKNLDENTTKLLQRLGILDGTFLSMEHFDKTLLGYMEELREGASLGVDLVLDKIKEESKKLLDKIGESDPEFAKKLMKKMEDLEGLTVEQKDTILEVLDGLHKDTTTRLDRIEKAIEGSKKEVLDALSKIAKGTETDKEIKKLVEDLIKTIKDNSLDNEALVTALERIAEKIDAIDQKLDANNSAIADILRKVIQEELNERLTRMEGKLDTLVSEGARKSDVASLSEQIEELKAMIAHLAQGGGTPPVPPYGPGGAGPGGYGPGGFNQNQNFNWDRAGRPGEGEGGGGRPPRESEEEPGGGKKKGEGSKSEPDKVVPKPEEKKPGAFSKAAGWGFGLGIPIALLLVLVFALSKIFGGGTSTTVSTVKTATVPLMPVTGSAASSSSFLPSGFMTPLIIILILVALFLLFPKSK